MPGRERGRQKVPFYQLRDRDRCARRSSSIANLGGQRRSRRELQAVTRLWASAQGRAAALQGKAGRKPGVRTSLGFYSNQEAEGPERSVLDPRFTACVLDLDPFTVLCKFKG